MVGATASTDGIQGLVPVPTAGQQNLFLRGDATWANPTAELQVQVGNLTSGLATVQGSDTTKSMRAVAQEEVAAIIDGADSSFDTLREIAEWISTHEDTADVVVLQNDVKNLKDLIYDKPAETDPDSGEIIAPASDGLVTRVGNLEELINGDENTNGLIADVNALDTRLTVVEGQVGNLNELLNGNGTPQKPGLVNKVDEIDGRLKWQDLVEEGSEG